MFNQDSILIVEDDILIATDLACQVEDLDGLVAGPVASVAEALEILERESVSGAILDGHLVDRDVTPVGLVLAERGVPFIVHSALGLPSELERAIPSIRLVPKPAPSYTVIAHLLATMAGD